MTGVDTTTMQARLLGMLRADRRVWSLTEMRQAMLEELGEPSDGGPSPAKVRAGVQALIGAGLCHRVSFELVCVSRSGILAKPRSTVLWSGSSAAEV
jgi:hypothetical protein